MGQLRDDATRVVRAEVEVRKARLRRKAGAIKGVAIFGGAAAVLALAALVALLVGLILSLATLIGPLGATAVVVGATLVIAALLGLKAKSHLTAMGGDA